MLVPMRSRGQAVGLFTFASCDPGRRYGPEDLEMVEELARRVVAAVDNARLYHEAAGGGAACGTSSSASPATS